MQVTGHRVQQIDWIGTVLGLICCMYSWELLTWNHRICFLVQRWLHNKIIWRKQEILCCLQLFLLKFGSSQIRGYHSHKLEGDQSIKSIGNWRRSYRNSRNRESDWCFVTDELTYSLSKQIEVLAQLVWMSQLHIKTLPGGFVWVHLVKLSPRLGLGALRVNLDLIW